MGVKACGRWQIFFLHGVFALKTEDGVHGILDSSLDLTSATTQQNISSNLLPLRVKDG